MKAYLKSAIIAVSVFLSFNLCAQTASDTAGFERAALDYINGWYSGNEARMQSSLHPMLNQQAIDGSTINSTQLVDYTRECRGCHTADKAVKFQILNMEAYRFLDFVHAVIKLESDEYIDYLFLTKAYGHYLITQVLWSYKTERADGDSIDLIQTITEYENGIREKDSTKIFSTVSLSFNSGQTKCYEVVESINYKWLTHYYRGYDEGFSTNDSIHIKILDISNGVMGLGIASNGTKTEYLQLAHQSGKWLVSNISRNYYTYLRGIEILNNKVDTNATASSIISEFDTRLHYDADIKNYVLTTEGSDKIYDNDNFEIVSKKLCLAVDAKAISKWPQLIRVRAISNFGDTVYQDFAIESTVAQLVQPLNRSEVEQPVFFPNPVTNILQIKCEQPLGALSLINAQGQMVFHNVNIQNNHFDIDLSGFLSGSYYLVVTNGSNSHSYKICKP